jgi:polyadenylate-binding protein
MDVSVKLIWNSIEDESALRAKVDEALTVYDEYVKNKGGEGEGEGGDAAKETKEDEKTEEKA